MTGRPEGAEGARHLISEVQRFGFLSAASVVDRYLEIVSRDSAANPFRHVREVVDRTAHSPRDGVAGLLEAGLQALEAAARLMSEALGPGPETLVMPGAEPGACSEASVWIHNRTASLVAPVELRATLLVSTEECSIPGDAVAFRPEAVVLVEPGASHEVTVRVNVPEGQAPGLYHGLLVGSGAPDGAVTLRLPVESQGGGSS